MIKAGRVLLAAASLAAFVGGVIYLSFVHGGYAKGRKEYAAISDEYTSLLAETEDEEENGMASYREEHRPAAGPQEGTQMEEKSIWKVLVADLPGDAPKRLKIDWAGLLEKNEDVVGWISIPAAMISYPVVRAEDNEYYLHRGIDREYLFAGCIFMDAFCTPLLTGYNTIIYGHNMRDGSMFAGLKEFQSEETLQSCPYFWIQTPSSDNLYEISSIHHAAPGSDTYMLRFSDHESYDGWLKEMSECSAPATGVETQPGDRIVTLSTCTQDSTLRMAVQGKLIYRERTGK